MPRPETRKASWHPDARPAFDVARIKASGTELESALVAAEHLLSRGQEDTRHAQNVRLATVSLSLLTVASMAGIIIAIVESAQTGGFIALAVLVSAALPVCAYLLHLMQDAGGSRASFHREVAIDIAGMVREVFLDVAEREEWSRVRIETTRLRLSAFPLRTRDAALRSASVTHLGDGPVAKDR